MVLTLEKENIFQHVHACQIRHDTCQLINDNEVSMQHGWKYGEDITNNPQHSFLIPY